MVTVRKVKEVMMMMFMKMGLMLKCILNLLLTVPQVNIHSFW